MKSKLLLYSILLSFLAAVNLNAGCCEISCDTVLNNAFDYVKDEVKKAFDKKQEEMKKYAQNLKKNIEENEKDVSVLKALLEREKKFFLETKRENYIAYKRFELYKIKYDSGILK